MFSLSPDLDHACSQLFNRCQEFARTGQLRALCTTTELLHFAAQLPDSSGTRSNRVQAVKAFLLEKKLTDGRALTTAPGVVGYVRRRLALLDTGLEGLVAGGAES